MTSPRLNVPDRFYLPIPHTNKPVPPAHHGVLLGRQQCELIAHAELDPIIDAEDGVIGIHRLPRPRPAGCPQLAALLS